MNIQILQDEISKDRYNLNKRYNGIIKVEKDITVNDINEILSVIRGRKNSSPNIAIIDSENRFIEGSTKIAISKGINENTHMKLSIDKKNMSKIHINILDIKPDYIIFRNLINEENIEDILDMCFISSNVISFTTLSKEELTQLIIKNTNLNEKMIRENLDILYKN